jgi:uncharacterized protein (DUF924 family)
MDSILNYWFGDLKSDEDFPVEKAKMWFQDGKSADTYIKETFGDDFKRALNGELDDWAQTPRGSLAYIILLDQFSRNIHRDEARSFEQDIKAAEISLRGISKGLDAKLRPVERIFFYMPLMHSEIKEIQEKSVEMFSKLAGEAPHAIEIPLRNSLDFAERHAAIVKRFGRFPYRNEVLGRKSTSEEVAYLQDANESWF